MKKENRMKEWKNRYSYAPISLEEWKMLEKECVSFSKEKVEQTIIKLLGQKLNESNAQEILSLYIEKNMSVSLEEKETEQLENFSFLLSSTNLKITEDFLTSLIVKYPLLKELLEKIVMDEFNFEERKEALKQPYSISLIENYKKRMESQNTIEELEAVLKKKESSVENSLTSYLSSLYGISVLPEKEVKTLIEEAQKGNEAAREQVIIHNLRLVVMVARQYKNMGIPFADLVQEGNIGLMKAIEKFDVTQEFHFSTYATWWIRNKITSSISHDGKTIRVPLYTAVQLRQLNDLELRLKEKLGYQPSDEELSIQLQVSVPRIKELRSLNSRFISLSEPIKESEELYLIEILEDHKIPTPQAVVEQKNLNEEITKLLSILPEREKKIIMMRYGLDGRKPKTLEEIGKMYGLTRERIRQIEVRVLKKLKETATSKELWNLIDLENPTKKKQI